MAAMTTFTIFLDWAIGSQKTKVKTGISFLEGNLAKCSKILHTFSSKCASIIKTLSKGNNSGWVQKSNSGEFS